MASNYLKALQLTKQLEKKAQEATHNRKLAEEEITAAEKIIKEAKKIDANVAKAEAKLTEATSAMSLKEFKSALDLAKESKALAKKAQEDHVSMVIDSTKNLVNLAKNLETKVPDLDENLKKADNAMKEGRYEEALDIAKKGWEEIDKLLNEQVSVAFTKAQSLIVLAKKIGQDISEVETLLDVAREHTKKNDYENALAFINECMQQTGRMAKEEISKSIENAMVSLEIAKGMETDTKKAEGLYNDAKAAMEKEEYERASNLAKQSINETSKLMEKQGKFLITQCEEEIKGAKNINAEVTKASLLLNRAKEALKSKNFEEVNDCANQIKEEIENAQFQSVLKTISLSRPKFIAAKNIGADLSEPMKFLDMARKSMKEKKFNEALEFARKGEHAVNKLISDYEGAKEELQLISKALTRASKIGVDTKTIGDLIKEAKSAFDTKDYKKAMNLISQCREKIEKAMYDRTMEVVEASIAVVSLGEKSGSDLTKAKKLLDQATAAINANDYEKGMELAKNSKEEAEVGMRKGIVTEIEALMKIGNSLKEGEEKDECMSALFKAKEALGNDDYDEAINLIMRFKNLLEEQVKNTIEIADKTLTTLKDMGGDASESEKKMNEVKALYKDKKYSDALSLVENVIREANDHQQNVVSDLFSSISDDIQQAKKLGIAVQEQDNRLNEVKEAIGKRFFKKAYTLMAKSQDNMKSLLGQHKELSDALKSVKSKLEEARKKGIDMSSPLKKVKEAEDALEAQDFDIVSKKIEEIDADINQLTTVHTIREKITTSKECMAVAKDLEMDTSDVEMQLKKTVIYLNNSEFENAIDSANKTLEKAEELCRLKISDMLSNGYSMIIEAKKIGLDVLTVEVLYQKAEEALDLGKFEKAAKYASQSLREIEEIRDESQRAANIIHLAGNYIQEAENINADVSEAKKLLEKAFSELKNIEYITSIEFGKKCIRTAKKAKEEKVLDVMSSFESIIEKSKNEGLDVSKAEFLLEEAKLALADEDYNEALRLAMLSESEVEKVDLQKKMASEAIAVTAAKLKEAEKIGIEAKNVKRYLMDATNALKNKDYVKALEFAMESGMELSEATEEFERAATTIHAAQARINESEEIGVDVKKAKELLETAKKVFRDKNYSIAMKYAKETIREAKGSYVGHLSKPIESCENLMKTAVDLGVNVSRAENMLNEAKAALEEESYSQVALFSKNCKKLIEREITGFLFEKVSAEKTKLSKGKGPEVKESTKMLKSVESALEEKKYIAAANNFQKYKEGSKFPETEAKKAEPKMEEEKARKPSIDIDKFISELDERMHRISKHGMNTKKTEKLLTSAKDIKEKEPEKALKLAEEAEQAMESELESFNPVITTEIDLGSVKKKDEWYEIPLFITNSGKSVAKDVSFTLEGKDFEVEGLEALKILKAKEKKEITLKIKATTMGNLKFLLGIKFTRIFDGRELAIELSHETEMVEETPKGPLFNKIKAEESMRCFACNGKIKPGFMMIKCNCGNTYHETCGERIGKCPMCGVDFKKAT